MKTRKVLSKLKNLKNAITNKPTDCFHFVKDRVFGFKEDIIISVKLKTGFSGSFSAKDIIKGLESLREEDFKMVLDDNDNMIIFNESSKIKICSNPDEFERMEEFFLSAPKSAWEELPDNYMSGLKLCAETASKDIKDGETSCIAIKDGIVESTDNMRASIFINEFAVNSPSYLASSTVKKLPDSCTHISINENSVEFKDGSCKYTIPKMEIEFPDIYIAVKEWIPKKRDLISFPKEIIKVAKDIEHFCGGDSNYEKTVTIKFTKKDVLLSAKKDTASIKKKIANTTENVDLKFAINPTMLSSVLSDGDEIFIHDDKIFFIKKDFIHLIGLMV